MSEKSEAARELGRKRWAETPSALRREHMRYLRSLPRKKKRRNKKKGLDERS